MKTLARACALSMLILVAAAGEGGDANRGEPLLAEIASAIESYRSKTVTLRLKLKRVDTVFEKIIFYDKKNHDIKFDISSKETRKRLSADMLNIHRGMSYLVTFTVRDRGNLGEVIGDLAGFRPAFLESLPEGG